jgi:hypothetical protein
MTDDLLHLAREAGLKAATEDEIVEELFRDPFEGVPSEVWGEFRQAAALIGTSTDGATEPNVDAESVSDEF